MTIEQAKNKIPIVAGQTFGRFTVKGEAPARTSPSGKSRRMVYVRCVCGEDRIVSLTALRRGRSKSCGCYSRDFARKAFTTHGGCKERLYNCWSDMLQRSKRRGCEVYPEWRKYEGFRDWAFLSGYEEHLVLCRNGDTGNYTPTNSRWDIRGNNMREAHAAYYEVMYPDGTTEIIRNLSEFCRNNDLHIPSACRVSTGERNHHKGYKFRRIDGESYEISNKDG